MTIVQDNIDRLTAFPLDAVGSVAADNIEKLRTFSVTDIRRVFTSVFFSSYTPTIIRSARREFPTVLIP